MGRFSYLPILIILFLITQISCVTEPKKKKSDVFIIPSRDMIPVLIQGYVYGEEYDKESKSNITFPLNNVKISVAKKADGESVSVSILSDNKGFFSISPDYVKKNSIKKYTYMVHFKKKGYLAVTKVLKLPSQKASRLNIILKRVQ